MGIHTYVCYLHPKIYANQTKNTIHGYSHLCLLFASQNICKSDKKYYTWVFTPMFAICIPKYMQIRQKILYMGIHTYVCYLHPKLYANQTKNTIHGYSHLCLLFASQIICKSDKKYYTWVFT